MFEICILMSNDVILINVSVAVQRVFDVFIRRGSRLVVLHTDSAYVSVLGFDSLFKFIINQQAISNHQNVCCC